MDKNDHLYYNRYVYYVGTYFIIIEKQIRHIYDMDTFHENNELTIKFSTESINDLYRKSKFNIE